MNKQKEVHKLLIRGENKPKLATEGKESKINFFVKNMGDITFPGGELNIIYFPVVLSDKAQIRETIRITEKIESNMEIFVGSGGLIPIASGYTMYCIVGAIAKDNIPIHVWEKNNKQCFPLQGREAQVFHSVRAQTHEEISQRQAVWIAVGSLVVVAIFQIADWIMRVFFGV